MKTIYNFSILNYTGTDKLPYTECTDWCKEQLDYAISYKSTEGFIILGIVAVLLFINSILANYGTLISEKYNIKESHVISFFVYSQMISFWLIVIFLMYRLIFA